MIYNHDLVIERSNNLGEFVKLGQRVRVENDYQVARLGKVAEFIDSSKTPLIEHELQAGGYLTGHEHVRVLTDGECGRGESLHRTQPIAIGAGVSDQQHVARASQSFHYRIERTIGPVII